MAPAAQTSKFVTGSPKILSLNDGSVRITHCELFSDIGIATTSALQYPAGQGAFIQQQISPLNPGLFPWLSQVANSYESYSFDKLEFTYDPFCSVGTQGTIIMAVDYDPTDKDSISTRPSSKTDLMSMEESVRTAVWSGISHKCKPKNLHKLFRERLCEFYSNQTGQTSESTKVVGTFYAAGFNASPAINQVGDLYVSYSVVLRTPQPNKVLADSRSMVSYSNIADGGPNSWTSTDLLNTPGWRWDAGFNFSVPTANSLVPQNDLNDVYVVMRQTGTGITVAPDFTVSGGAIKTENIIDTYTATDSLYVSRVYLPQGSQITFNTAVATTVTSKRFWILPASNSIFKYWGDTYVNIGYRDWETDRKSTRLNSSHRSLSRMPSSA